MGCYHQYKLLHECHGEKNRNCIKIFQIIKGRVWILETNQIKFHLFALTVIQNLPKLVSKVSSRDRPFDTKFERLYHKCVFNALTKAYDVFLKKYLKTFSR